MPHKAASETLFSPQTGTGAVRTIRALLGVPSPEEVEARRAELVHKDRQTCGYYVEQRSVSLVVLGVWLFAMVWLLLEFANALDQFAEQRRVALNFLEETASAKRDFRAFQDAIDEARRTTARSLAVGALRLFFSDLFVIRFFARWESSIYEAWCALIQQHVPFTVLIVAMIALFVGGVVLSVRAVVDWWRWREETSTRPMIRTKVE